MATVTAIEKTTPNDSPHEGRATRPASRKRKPAVSRASIVAAMIGLLLVVLIITGLLPRWHRRTELAAMAKARASARSVVTVVRPQPAPESRELVLPGTAQAAHHYLSARQRLCQPLSG